jgi:carbamoyl-phosphate synthase large subunit
MPSILISSAGRKISLLTLFKNAAHARGWRVIAGDYNLLAPALFMADEAVQLPAVTTEEYLPRLIELAQSREIRLIVSGIDTDLLLLAQNAKRFLDLGCRVLGSSPEFVAIARDKWCTATCFSNFGIATPRSWLTADLEHADLPQKLFVKPRTGSGSMHAYRASRDNLDIVLRQVPNAIVQEELEGAEITVDALLNFSGTPLHYVPRLRIRTVGGESIEGRTISDAEIRAWLLNCLKLAGAMGAAGPLALQAFLTERGPVLTEINPRFGGGFPLSYAAGAHYPQWILELLDGHEMQPRIGEYVPDLYMTRYYREHFFTKPNSQCLRNDGHAA